MAVEYFKIEVDDEELDAAIEKLDRALEGVQNVEEAADEVLGKKKDLPTKGELADIEFTQRRILMMMPGVREAYSMMTQVQTLLKLSPQLAALLVTAMLIKEAVDYFKRVEEKMKEMEDLVKQYRGFKNRKEAREFIDEQNRLVRQTYQGGNP